jgi:hypothetical protein
MPGRSPAGAYSDFIDPIQEALNLIAVGRLSVSHRQGGIEVGVQENVAFNGNDPALLRSATAGPIFLTVSMRVEVARIDIPNAPFDCRLTGYWYEIRMPGDRELIAYHWTPEIGGNQRPFPHLHIGSVVASGGQVMPNQFNKLHIPTGLLPAAAIVRFAIEELGVSVRPGKTRNAALQRLSTLIGTK